MSSTPNVSLDVLRTLHRIHRQLSDLKDRKDRGPKQIRAGETNIKHREDELAKLREEIKGLKKTVDQKQLQLKANEQKIKDLRTKLNAAASNREYQILKEQIAADEMANSVLEDEIIEALEHVDAFQPKITEAEAALKAGQDRAAVIHAEIDKQQPLIQGDIARLEAELKQCEVQLPPPVLESYQRRARLHGEDALAPVIDGSCGGCHQQVPLNIQAEIRMAHPAFCKTCGRLLYLPEDASPARAPDE